MVPESAVKFKVLVIGAGIGGLAVATCLAQKGHHVRVLERKDDLSEFGAGIQILPNAVRCINAWGLTREFDKYTFKPDRLVMRRGQTGEVIGGTTQNYKNTSVIRYGAEHWQMHRADYQKVLADAAREAGAEVVFNARVAIIDALAGKVECEDGRTFQGDLVVGADGLRSKTRSFLPENAGYEPRPFDEIAYRTVLTRDQMMSKPETAKLMESKGGTAWLAGDMWVLTYPISGGNLYNVACPRTHPNKDIPLGVNTPLEPEKLRQIYKDFCPDVRSILSLVEHCAIWPTADIPPLPTWVSQSGKVVLSGDAAHAMTAHLAQGGATCIEDAAVLGECLSWCRTASDLPRATRAYQDIRKPRCDRLMEVAHTAAEIIRLADGDAQTKRDGRFKKRAKLEEEEMALPESERAAMPKPRPDMNAPYGEPAFSQWQCEYDAIEEARQHLSQLERRTM